MKKKSEKKSEKKYILKKKKFRGHLFSRFKRTREFRELFGSRKFSVLQYIVYPTGPKFSSVSLYGGRFWRLTLF